MNVTSINNLQTTAAPEEEEGTGFGGIGRIMQVGWLRGCCCVRRSGRRWRLDMRWLVGRMYQEDWEEIRIRMEIGIGNEIRIGEKMEVLSVGLRTRL